MRENLSTQELRSIIREEVTSVLKEVCSVSNLRKNGPLTLEEVSVYTGKSIPTIYRLTSSGQIPYFKKGKRLYFSRVEIDAWLHSGKRVLVENI